MSTCYSKGDAKRIQWIKTCVVKVENKKARLARWRIEERLIERQLDIGATLDKSTYTLI
tara:strand:- start:347 stop:523 length:177 start_codon:yes stop_codon:yes gene_type:complete